MSGAPPTLADSITILRALGGALLAKTVTRARIEAYDHAVWFAIEEATVDGIIELGRLLARLQRDAHACVVRGRPLPGINRARCRRLLYAQLEDGAEVPATFEPAARRWLALDVDSLPLPGWDPDDLARRQAAIARDHELCPDVSRPDLEGDLDPRPIDPVHDPELLVRHVTSQHLPEEFRDAHAWWQLTAGAGIKPGIRLRLWYWLDREVSDAEVRRRWLADAPVDLALCNPIQPHYTAAPVFSPPSLDPVPVRSGMWWRHVPAVAVPALPEPPPPPPVERRPLAAGDNRRARAYAQTIIDGIEAAHAADLHKTMRSGATRLYGMAAHGLIDPGEVTRSLLAIGKARSRPEPRLYSILAWARAVAEANPKLPEALR